MQMCNRCHQRVAVVFISRMEEGRTVNEGICLKCARELGIKPVNDMLDKMGITEEDFDRMSAEMGSMLQSLGSDLPSELDEENGEDGGAPAIDLPKIFQQDTSDVPAEPEKKRAGNRNGVQKKEAPKRKYLTTYCQDLTARAREGKLDRIVGRERELERVIQILCRRQKNNPCLIGEPGVGKTAIAEALAQRIASGDVPYRLQGCEVHLVDLTALVAGTQFRGQFESRVLGLLNEVKEAGNIILVIDEVHNIVGAGEGEGSMNAANMLKPALSRGEVQVIGATTLKEYRKYIEKDSALERRFQPVTVGEPSVDESYTILCGIKDYYETFHGIHIPDAVLRSAVVLSERYITDRYLPDKAIDLLDEAASHVSLSSVALNEKRRTEKELQKLGAEKAEAEAMPDGESEEKYRRLADIKVRELQLLEKQAALESEAAAVTLTVGDLADVIEIWTGVPATSIKADEFSRLDGLEKRLLGHIVGQDEAVSAVVRAIKRSRAGVSSHRAPVSFIFAGPTGVGKTELVKVLAADLFKLPETLIRLDMSEFMEKHSVSKIIGAPPGYVGYDEAGQLTEKIRRRPYSVVLFDEIEKAHPDVLNIMLQILDEGKLTDAQGRVVNFENTVIVMTTNAGSGKSGAISGFGGQKEESGAQANTERALASFLRPEFINRVDEIITFRHLDEGDFTKIAAIMLGKLRDALAEKGIDFTWTDAAAAKIAADSFSYKFGARSMRRHIQTEVEDPLAEEVIRHYDSPVTHAALSVKDGKLKITCQ